MWDEQLAAVALMSHACPAVSASQTLTMIGVVSLVTSCTSLVDGESESEGPSPGGPAVSSTNPATGAVSEGSGGAASTTTGETSTTATTTATATAAPTVTATESVTGSSGGESTGEGETGAFDGSPLADAVTTEVYDFLEMALADVNADGRADLILQGTGAPPRVTIYPGLADGHFGAGVTTDLSTFVGLAAGDVDGDGAADVIVAASGQPPRVVVHRATPGELGVGAGVTTQVWSFDPQRMVVTDLNVDGRADLVLDNNGGAPPTLFLHAGGADLGFSPLGEATVWSYGAIAAGDVDGDGDGDVLTGTGDNFPRIWAWPGDGAGDLGEAIESGVFTFTILAVGDLDGDGIGDAITDVPGNAWRLQLLRGLGDGGFAPAVVHDGANFDHIVAGDVDGDGRADVVTRPSGWPPRVDVYRAL